MLPCSLLISIFHPFKQPFPLLICLSQPPFCWSQIKSAGFECSTSLMNPETIFLFRFLKLWLSTLKTQIPATSQLIQPLPLWQNHETDREMSTVIEYMLAVAGIPFGLFSGAKAFHSLFTLHSNNLLMRGKDFDIYYVPLFLINAYWSLGPVGTGIKVFLGVKQEDICNNSAVLFTHFLMGTCILQIALNWMEVAGTFHLLLTFCYSTRSRCFENILRNFY